MQDISVIIITFNEQRHIRRCIESVLGFTNKIFVVDSGSTDETISIAESLGAKVMYNHWVNHATQINFAIRNNPYPTTWVMRLDADEYVMPELAHEINQKLSSLPESVTGIHLKRRVVFLNKWIRYGGYYPIWLMRIWKNGKGFYEQRWMDEHLDISDGQSIHFENDIIDKNLNNLSWWTQKHNSYSIGEAIDLLSVKYDFKSTESIKASLWGNQEQRTRFIKLRYANMPLFWRAIFYFLYRYFFKLGILDGRRGLIWHVLQGFWYRFLVDAKIYEIYQKAGKDKQAILQYFKTEYGKDLQISEPTKVQSPILTEN
jgi:glycosyltransferase involved in cell wall biosynthesis